jgi:hypothetical protein
VNTKICSRFLLFFSMMFFMSVASFAQVGISVSFGPPALPVYEQPLCPGQGYIWTPGYWAYDYDYSDYYWVPATWVLAPQVGYLWTPPYWGWGGDGYLFHQGYWGPQVGFYGGIAYGYGYFGRGYDGGRWQGNQFYYNRSVNNVTNITNVYNTTVVNNSTTVNRVSYNGGNGGVTAQPTAAEQAAARERHIPPVAAQTQHIQAAQSNPQLRASANEGKPPIAATARPASFTGSQVVPAKAAGAPYHPPANRAAAPSNNRAAAAEPTGRTSVPQPANEPPARAANTPVSHPTNEPPARAANAPTPHPENNTVPRPPAHASELAPHQQPPVPNTGNPKTDQRYQQQQQKLYQQQQQDHQKLAQKQEQDHQRMAQQQANAGRQQQVEQQHQQQTQQMEQKHAQQQQQLNARQAPPASHPPAAAQARPPAEASHPTTEKR